MTFNGLKFFIAITAFARSHKGCTKNLPRGKAHDLCLALKLPQSRAWSRNTKE